MSETNPRTESLFAAALAIDSPAERAGYLDQACGADAQLRAQVEQLLTAYPKVERFLEEPVLRECQPPAPTISVDQAVSERPGTVIGPYKLLEQIGEGGFGVVFMAEQTQPIRRKVALEVLKPGMDTRQVVARFEAERQALALMDHPNIARVFDGGATASGRPFFVMELVRGVPITTFCDQNRLGVRARLELFVHVCQAVQHSHQKGIIHRDLKPSNVLVTLHDAVPVVKVIDFGIAKATGVQLTDKTLFTHFAQMLGTPLYMSPEQAQLSGLDVDTRSDIYALGVLLYELLTGTTPFDKERLRTAGYDELRRIIREEEPPRPSTRLSTIGQAASTVSANRGSDPKRLGQLVRGELDWIVMKCLEKDRNRRYESAAGLALDVQRYLADEPVQACPPSAAYRLRKFVRRHQRKLSAAVAALALVLTAAAVSTWQAVRATRAEWETRDALAQVTAEQTKTQAALTAETTAKAQAQTSLTAETAARAQAHEALDTLTDDVVETMFARQPELQEAEKGFLRKVFRFYQTAAQQLGKTAEARLLQAKGAFKVGRLHALLGEPIQAESAYRQAAVLLRELADEAPEVADYREKLARTLNSLGRVLVELGKEVEAETALRQALDLRKKLVNDFPKVSSYRLELAGSYNDLATLLKIQRKYAEAEQAGRQALDLNEKLAAEAGTAAVYQQALARSRANLGTLLSDQGKYAQAEELFRQALKVQQKHLTEFPTVPQVRRELADSYHGLGIVLAELKKEAEAEKAFRQALDLRKKLADDFPKILQYRRDLAGDYKDLGYLLWRQRAYADAEAAYRQALDLEEKIVAEAGAVPKYRQELAGTCDNFGHLLRLAGRPLEAETAWRDGLAHWKQLADDCPKVADYRYGLAGTLGNLARLHKLRGQFAEAVALLEQARSHIEAALEASPKNALYRLCHRNHLLTLAQCHLHLADHGRLATTAAELARSGHDPANDNYLAACCVCSCVMLAGKASQLTEARRKELTQTYSDQALALLRQVMASGFKDAVRLKMDPDLEPLRARQEFWELLTRLEGKSKA
jgi:serine/threonine protein kinase/tetratricopeptide (TPR) repeat protein